MKKVIKILLVCLFIAGIIVIATLGFNVGTKYSENTQIGINIGKEFNIKDIKEITDEVFNGQRVIIQQVEMYKDMVQINVQDASEQQISDLNTKINEKFEIDNALTDVEVTHNANVKLKSIVKPYIIPMTIISIIVIIYTMLAFRKLGVLKVLYNTAMAIIIPEATLISLYAVARIPVNRLTMIIGIMVYIMSITLNIVYLIKVQKGKEKEKNKNKNKK